jgi:hypothetical protein
MLAIFFNSRWVVHHEYAPQGQTITKEYYQEVHIDRIDARNNNKTTATRNITVPRPRSPSSSSARATNQLDIPLSNILSRHEHEKDVHFIDKHIEQETKTGNIPQSSSHSTTSTTDFAIPKTINRKRLRRDVNSKHSDITDGTPRNKNPKRNISDNQIPSTSQGLPSHSPPDTHQTDSNTHFTFTVHKTNLRNIPAPTRRAPTFAAFDHGDHFHFLFSVAQTNTNRIITNILQFLGCPYSKIAEAHTSSQQIRFIDRFMAYLIRKGLRSFYKYGAKQMSILKRISTCLSNIDEADSSDFEPCNLYTEEEKKNRLQKKPLQQGPSP